MEVRGQPHDQAAFVLGKELIITIKYKAGRAAELVRMFW
jgi:hypothetical protein